jgi:hypothetical protein
MKNIESAGGIESFVSKINIGSDNGIVHTPEQKELIYAEFRPSIEEHIVDRYERIKSTLNISNNVANTNVANTNVANTNVANTNVSSTNVANTNVANTNVASTNVASTNVANTNVASTNVASTNVASTNVANTNVANTNVTNNDTENDDTGDDDFSELLKPLSLDDSNEILNKALHRLTHVAIARSIIAEEWTSAAKCIMIMRDSCNKDFYVFDVANKNGE